MDLVEVKGTDFVRDTKTKALLNKNHNELEQYKLRRNLILEQRKEINNIKEEVNSLRDDMKEIKDLLLKNLEKE